MASSSKQNVQSEINKINNLASKAMRKLGYEEFGNKLKAMVVGNELTEKNYDVYINFILNCVEDEWRGFEIKKEDFFESNKRGEMIVARKMAIILIKEHCSGVSDNKLSGYFGNRCRQVVYGVRKEFEKMSWDNKWDIDFLKKHEKLNKQVLAFIDDFNSSKTLKNK